MMEEIRRLKMDKTKEKGSQHNPEHAANKEERVRAPKERFYAQRPPYPLRVLSKPYLERYKPRVFTQYIDTLGLYAIDEDLCLREISKSLCD